MQSRCEAEMVQQSECLPQLRQRRRQGGNAPRRVRRCSDARPELSLCHACENCSGGFVQASPLLNLQIRLVRTYPDPDAAAYFGRSENCRPPVS
jgi:hypothetical protein